LVNETFLHADDPDPKIRGFTLYRTDRTNGAGGGTTIFVRRTLPHYPNALPALQNLEATAVTIEQWRLVGFIVEEANLNKHSNNKYTIIIIFLNILYRCPKIRGTAYQYVVK
jgi:hypothetical protein